MITATSSPDRFGSLLRGLLKKNISNMVYLALIGFIGIPLPYLLAMFRRWEEKGQWVYENISTADRGGLYVFQNPSGNDDKLSLRQSAVGVLSQ